MTKTSEEALIAILVEKLGGEVTITHEDFARADEIEVTRWDDSQMTMSYRLTTERPPEILQGEIVTVEPQSIEAFTMQPSGPFGDGHAHLRDSAGYCATCGAPPSEAHVVMKRRESEPVKHQHEQWQLARRFDGWLFCQACGEDIQHDPEMTINTYESLQ